MKLGLFSCGDLKASFPEPSRSLRLSSESPEASELHCWFDQLGHDAGGSESRLFEWRIGSVCRPATTRLLEWIRAARPHDSVVLLSSDDVGLAVDLPHPDMVGIDRLLDARGADALRTRGCAAVVVDVGTAVTVDFLNEEGVFRGGAILPGLGMSARALHEFTDLLPLLEMQDLAEPPAAVGRDTVAAMKSGLYWGTLGAVRELSQRMASNPERPPEYFLTGGAGKQVAALLGESARYVPDLTLGGIALTAR